VLCAFVDLAREHLRSCDVIARTGGEEFVLLLPNMNAAEAARVAEGLRHSFEQMRVHYDGKMIVATASFGATERQHGESLTTMMKRADALLYRAKSEGRNRVVADDAARKPVLVDIGQQRRSDRSA
jgi:diguanylate cyclase (GGDEF)-like protein